MTREARREGTGRGDALPAGAAAGRRRRRRRHLHSRRGDRQGGAHQERARQAAHAVARDARRRGPDAALPVVPPARGAAAVARHGARRAARASATARSRRRGDGGGGVARCCVVAHGVRRLAAGRRRERGVRGEGLSTRRQRSSREVDRRRATSRPARCTTTAPRCIAADSLAAAAEVLERAARRPIPRCAIARASTRLAHLVAASPRRGLAAPQRRLAAHRRFRERAAEARARRLQARADPAARRISTRSGTTSSRCEKEKQGGGGGGGGGQSERLRGAAPGTSPSRSRRSRSARRSSCSAAPSARSATCRARSRSRTAPSHRPAARTGERAVLGVALVAQLAIAANGPDTATACLPIQRDARRCARRAASRRDIEPPQRRRHCSCCESRVASRVEPDGAAQFSTITEASADVAIGAGRAASSCRRSSPIVDGTRDQLRPDRRGRAPRRSRRLAVVLVDARARRRARRRVARLAVRRPAGGLRGRRAAQRAGAQAAASQPDVLPAGDGGGARVRRRHPARRAARRGAAASRRSATGARSFRCFPGASTIPPAVLTYSLPLSSSFFSREESFELRTDSVRFVASIRRLPAGRADYAGAVGTLRIGARTRRPARAHGRSRSCSRCASTAAGNVKLLPRPALALPWATITPGDERVQVDSTASARSAAARSSTGCHAARGRARRSMPVDPLSVLRSGDRSRTR